MFGLFQYHTNQKSRGVVLGGFIVVFFFSPQGNLLWMSVRLWGKKISRVSPCYIVKFMQMILSCYP